jgi:hypothetical protein
MATNDEEDILRGGEDIAEFILGDRARHQAVYRAIRAGQMPGYRVGAGYCARRSVLAAWRDAQEQRAFPNAI